MEIYFYIKKFNNSDSHMDRKIIVAGGKSVKMVGEFAEANTWLIRCGTSQFNNVDIRYRFHRRPSTLNCLKFALPNDDHQDTVGPMKIVTILQLPRVVWQLGLELKQKYLSPVKSYPTNNLHVENSCNKSRRWSQDGEASWENQNRPDGMEPPLESPSEWGNVLGFCCGRLH